MRNLIIAVVAALVAVGGYFWQKGTSVQDMADKVAQTAPVTADVAVEEVVADAAETTEAAEQGVEAAVADAAETTEAAEQVVEEVIADAAETTEAAEQVVEEAVADAAETTEAVEQVVEEAAAPVEAAEETAAEAAEVVDAVKEQGAGLSIAELLTMDGFNYDKVAEYIDGSDMGLVTKTGAKALLDQVKTNPEALPAILTQLKDTLIK